MSSFKTREKKRVVKGAHSKNVNDLITYRGLRDSKSSNLISMRGMRTGQLTENSVIFDDIVKGSGANVHLSLFFKNKAPIDFNVREWFDNKSLVMRGRISELMLDVAFGVRFQETCKDRFLGLESGGRILRCVTSDVVRGENSDLIGYLFYIEYNRM